MVNVPDIGPFAAYTVNGKLPTDGIPTAHIALLNAISSVLCIIDATILEPALTAASVIVAVFAYAGTGPIATVVCVTDVVAGDAVSTMLLCIGR